MHQFFFRYFTLELFLLFSQSPLHSFVFARTFPFPSSFAALCSAMFLFGAANSFNSRCVRPNGAQRARLSWLRLARRSHAININCLFKLIPRKTGCRPCCSHCLSPARARVPPCKRSCNVAPELNRRHAIVIHLVIEARSVDRRHCTRDALVNRPCGRPAIGMLDANASARAKWKALCHCARATLAGNTLNFHSGRMNNAPIQLIFGRRENVH